MRGAVVTVGAPAPVPAGVAAGRRLVQDSAALAMGQAAALAAAAASGLLAARWLGPQGRGQLVLALAVASLLAPLAAGGIDTFIAARSRLDADLPERAVAVLGLRAARWGGAGVAVATLAYGLAEGLPAAVVVLAAAVALVRPTLAVVHAIATGRDRVVAVGAALTVSAITQLVAVWALSAGGATVGDFVTASLLGVVAGGAVLVPVIGWPSSTSWAVLDPPRRRRVVRFGRTVVLGDALQAANYRLDVLVLAAFVPVAEVGVYAVALTLVEVVWQLPQAVSRSLLPRTAAGEMDRAGVVRLAAVLAVGLVALSAAGLALTRWLTVPVLGPDYAAVPSLLAVLLPGVLLVGATKPLAAWTLGQGEPGRNLRASAVGFVALMAGDLVLIPRYGTPGAALACTLAYALTAAAVVAQVPQIAGTGRGSDPAEAGRGARIEEREQ